jgi:hypothetical protein
MKIAMARGRFRTVWRVSLTVLLLAFAQYMAFAQDSSRGVEKVVLITLDGLRAEEVFSGADPRLIVKENGVDEPEETKRNFWREDRIACRQSLLPFLWEKCESDHGWIAGDFENNSRVSVTNGLFFSYPGYNEILTGRADPKIRSNDKKYNSNITVLEWLHQKPEFAGKVAMYGSWDVFPFIVNDRRSGIPVNAGWMPLKVGNAERVDALNLVSEQLFREWSGVRYDVLTASGAIEELKTNQPRVLYVALGETDDWAHKGRYDRYLLTARQNDHFMKLLWETTQSLAAYKDKTLFIVTTDHGRGDGREGWKNHGTHLPGSDRIWIAAFGAGLCKTGIDQEGSYRQTQIAPTLAAALGFDFSSSGEGIDRILPFIDCSNLPSKSP